MQVLNSADIKKLLASASRVILANEVQFCELDSAAGDGDFGMSIAKGFRVVEAELPGLPEGDIGGLLRACAMLIMEHCGGASGPIWGAAFTGAGRAAKGKTSLNLGEFADMADAAVEAIQKKGGAKRGDKTLLDALIPAAEALREGARAGDDFAAALAGAAGAAAAGAEATKGMVASRGRASYVGERSLNHPDAGAFALGVIFAAVAKDFAEKD